MGGWHEKAKMIKMLARAQARSTGKEEEDTITQQAPFPFQMLVVMLIKRKRSNTLPNNLTMETGMSSNLKLSTSNYQDP